MEANVPIIYCYLRMPFFYLNQQSVSAPDLLGLKRHPRIHLGSRYTKYRSSMLFGFGYTVEIYTQYQKQSFVMNLKLKPIWCTLEKFACDILI